MSKMRLPCVNLSPSIIKTNTRKQFIMEVGVIDIEERKKLELFLLSSLPEFEYVHVHIVYKLYSTKKSKNTKPYN